MKFSSIRKEKNGLVRLHHFEAAKFFERIRTDANHFLIGYLRDENPDHPERYRRYGGPGTDAACGTAEAVDFALHGSYYPASGVSLRSGSNEAVIHVFTPRGARTDEPAGTIHVLGDADHVGNLYSVIWEAYDLGRSL